MAHKSSPTGNKEKYGWPARLTQIMDNAGFVTVCCSMSMVSRTSCSDFACQGSYSATHTLGLLKLHNKVMSWISGDYECHYPQPLPEANATTVRDLTVPSVSSLPLSVMVRSHAFICVELVHHGSPSMNSF